jgi:GNAT superfamily N-acetyltransferase
MGVLPPPFLVSNFLQENLMTEYQWDNFTISTVRDKLDMNFIRDYLSNQSYWAQGRSHQVTEKAIQNSLCFGVYDGERQIGFARLVTDYATFAWLCDVFIADSHQGRGLGKWLIECVVTHPELQAVKYIILATRDAHELYRKYGGFESPRALDKWMVRYRVDET